MENEINSKVFKEYLEIENQIKELENKKKACQSEMLNEMLKNEVDNVKTDDGLFYVKINKTYHFSDIVCSQEIRIKDELKRIKKEKMSGLESVKKQEIESKTAKVTEIPTVIYRRNNV
jgi:hypothetical protein